MSAIIQRLANGENPSHCFLVYESKNAMDLSDSIPSEIYNALALGNLSQII